MEIDFDRKFPMLLTIHTTKNSPWPDRADRALFNLLN